MKASLAALTKRLERTEGENPTSHTREQIDDALAGCGLKPEEVWAAIPDECDLSEVLELFFPESSPQARAEAIRELSRIRAPRQVPTHSQGGRRIGGPGAEHD